MNHLVRVGALAQVGRFRSAEALRYRRGARVIVRTARGLEIGAVLAEDASTHGDGAHGDGAHGDSTCDAGAKNDGALLRRMTVSDELLAARLEKNRHAAYESCVRLLKEQGLTAALLDVEHLFDGCGLYFYFLGETNVEIEALTSQLAGAYEAEARFEQFADAVSVGCGPDCGTEEAQGNGGCASCAGCSASGGCGTKVKSA